MDRNPSIAAMLTTASIEDLLKLRELAVRAGLTRLAKAADEEIRRRTLEGRLRPYRASLRRVP